MSEQTSLQGKAAGRTIFFIGKRSLGTVMKIPMRIPLKCGLPVLNWGIVLVTRNTATYLREELNT
jgi:hypothetical protein